MIGELIQHPSQTSPCCGVMVTGSDHAALLGTCASCREPLWFWRGYWRFARTQAARRQAP